MALPDPPDPYLGEIRLFAGNFEPKDWAFCDGRLLLIDQNDALYTLIGTAYGGDGVTTFALPDLQGRVPVSFFGNTPPGTHGGQESVSLNLTEMPSHRHVANCASETGSGDPTN